MQVPAEFLKQVSFLSIILKLVLAAVLGGIIGLEREHKGRPAGFRTYMLVCLGAALSIITSQYLATCLKMFWSTQAELYGLKVDTSRIGAHVVNGIGFLGAGTILVTSRQEVKGLTTAAGLWACGCLGLVVGTGFYSCALCAFALIVLSYFMLPAVENLLLHNSRNANLYVEFGNLADIRDIVQTLKARGVRLYEVDIEQGRRKKGMNPSAVLYVCLPRRMDHHLVMSEIADLPGVCLVDEV